MNSIEVAELQERRRRLREDFIAAGMSDHAVPYAATQDLAAVLPASSELWEGDHTRTSGDLWQAYWRRRAFRERRHANPFPRFHLFTRRARA